MKRICPVILCGGSGTRLWPLSRAGFPKQFLVLSGTHSLFQQVYQRVNRLSSHDIEVSETIVVTNEEHRFLVLDQLRELESKKTTILLEPEARNTAPAMTLAALLANQHDVDSILVVTPSDQVIKNDAAFNQSLTYAINAAEHGAIVVLGVSPDKPETGYGYIKKMGQAGKYGEFAVQAFVEKPSLDIALTYIADGNYAWNSGMFVVKASVWLTAIKKFRADILSSTEKAWKARQIDQSFIRPGKSEFEAIPKESIDYAVIEKCPGSFINISMVPLNAGWSDLGAWDAVWQEGNQDEYGNVVQGDTLLTQTTNTVVHATSRLVSVIGVSDLVIVETADAVLVAAREKSQAIKEVIVKLEQLARVELVEHRKVQRPWGWYDSIDQSDRFKVKRIMVRPGASLSLQKHCFRAEHWIVVRGTAEVTCGDVVSILTENQSIYIPLGEKHRLKNPTDQTLEIIEVQSGSYLGEDDIERFDDTYGRATVV